MVLFMMFLIMWNHFVINMWNCFTIAYIGGSSEWWRYLYKQSWWWCRWWWILNVVVWLLCYIFFIWHESHGFVVIICHIANTWFLGLDITWILGFLVLWLFYIGHLVHNDFFFVLILRVMGWLWFDHIFAWLNVRPFKFLVACLVCLCDSHLFAFWDYNLISWFFPCVLWYCHGFFMTCRKYFVAVGAVFLISLVFFE